MAQSKKWTQPDAFRFHQRKGCKNPVPLPREEESETGLGCVCAGLQMSWACSCHTCWLKSILRTESALSFLETTAWFGTMPRWHFWASVTGFLVPSRHSSSKSFCFRSLAQPSGFFPVKRETRSTDSFYGGNELVTNHPCLGESQRHKETIKLLK